MNELEEHHKNITKGARIVGAIFGCVFVCVGFLVLGFLWSQPFGGFGSPPLFFRLFGSLVAIPFVAIGGFTAYSSIMGVGISKSNLITSSAISTKQGSYTCPKCNAPLSDNVDVSPHGDVKCAHCDSWFNIHHE
ncbi:hypothetical protein [uncultured Gimesia sp.]|uniref:hypothetical protein n=1 Tax=uncultured Gimesia sp. TaxID=1678688 RepID=UPI00260B59AD|nr:hypothetical protein [uncultured Gimesia sp.]